MELPAKNVLRDSFPEALFQGVVRLQQLQEVTPHKGAHWSPVAASGEGRRGEGDEGGPTADTVQRKDPQPPAPGPAISTHQGLLRSLATENHVLFVDKQHTEAP